jgi:hypothetical protein
MRPKRALKRPVMKSGCGPEGQPPAKRPSTDSKKTLWKCKKCNYRWETKLLFGYVCRFHMHAFICIFYSGIMKFNHLQLIFLHITVQSWELRLSNILFIVKIFYN